MTAAVVETPVTDTPAAPVESLATGMVVREEESTGSIAAFASQANFVSAQRMAMALASSSVVPREYQRSVANCLVAMELASRTGASVLMVMQNLYVINGRPSWSAAFLIASVNSCGRFTPLRFETKGEPEKAGWACRAIAKDKETGDVLEGEWITWSMAHGEGWVTRKDSKWKTMPGQMMRYRAASFWVRVYAPEISIGMRTADEVEDIPDRVTSVGTADLNRALEEADEIRIENAEIQPA